MLPTSGLHHDHDHQRRNKSSGSSTSSTSAKRVSAGSLRRLPRAVKAARGGAYSTTTVAMNRRAAAAAAAAAGKSGPVTTALLGALILSLLAENGSTATAAAAAAGASISGVSITPTHLAPSDEFTASWTYFSGDTAKQATTGDLTSFDIDIEHCVNGAGTCQCTGTSLTSLCPQETGCVDSDGSYDLSLPPSSGLLDESTTAAAVTPGEVYQVRVSLASQPAIFSCGYGFVVQEPDSELPVVDGRTTSSDASSDGTGHQATVVGSLTVFPPDLDNELIVPGEAFTARWVYHDGLDEDEERQAGVGSAGDFAVDLYTCDDGACNNGR